MMPGSVSFKLDVSKWIEKCTDRTLETVKRYALAQHEEVKALTPERSGELRDSWQGQLNAKPGKRAVTRGRRFVGILGGGDVEVAIAAMQLGDRLYIYN